MEHEVVHILIIDDSEDDAFSIRRLLNKEGIDAHCQRVDTPATLRLALAQQTWDIALCDIKMPCLTAEEAIAIMDQSEPPRTSIILMSGSVDISNIADLIRGGIRDFLPKDQLNRLASMLKRELSYIDAYKAQKIEHEMFVEAQKMEALGTLAGGVAHDFNNILTALLGMQWSLKNKHAQVPGLVQKIEKMDDLCYRASDLVKQLLGFARKGPMHLEDIDLGQFIGENMELFCLPVRENIQVHWQPPVQALNILADRTLLQQMLINLINNANHAAKSSQRPCIQIHASIYHASEGWQESRHVQQDDWIYVSVSNNGEPIPESVRAHIFEPFFTTKQVGEGTGLGLAMIYGSMHELKGFVELYPLDLADQQADSDELCTEFRLFFPVQTSHASTRQQSKLMPPAALPLANQPTRARKILVADDEDVIREVIASVLIMEGFEVSTCADGLQALQAFESAEQPYDAVILDVVMPKMEGPEVARAIRQHSLAPILLISGYDLDQMMGLVEGLGGIHVAHKPFMPEALIQQLTDILSESL